MYYNKNMKNR